MNKSPRVLVLAALVCLSLVSMAYACATEGEATYWKGVAETDLTLANQAWDEANAEAQFLWLDLLDAWDLYDQKLDCLTPEEEQQVVNLLETADNKINLANADLDSIKMGWLDPATDDLNDGHADYAAEDWCNAYIHYYNSSSSSDTAKKEIDDPGGIDDTLEEAESAINQANSILNNAECDGPMMP